MLFGNKQRFAVEVGEFRKQTATLRRVDIWAANRWWTCDDNLVYIPQFRTDVRDTLSWLRSATDLSLPFPGLSPAETHRRLLAADDGQREQFWFPMWGPTTDNITAHLFRLGESVIIPFEFWRPAHPFPDELGKIFVSELPEAEFLRVLEEMQEVLDTPE